LLERAQLRAETTVHTEYFLINNSSNRQAIEAIGESFPQLYVVAALALIVKPIDSVNRGAFVISSEQEEVLRIFNFISEKKTHCFE
jgi:hypothetical protein